MSLSKNRYSTETRSIYVSYKLIVILLIVSLIVSISLVYEGSIPIDMFFVIAIAIAYIVFMRLLVEIGSKTLYKLKVERIYLQPIIEGKDLTIRTRIYNPTSIPLLYVELSDLYPSLFKLKKGFNVISGLLPAKGYVELSYTVEPRIGTHVFSGVEIVVKDPLGIFSYKDVIPNSSSRVRVYPKPYPIPARALHRWITTSLGLTKSRLRGIGTEFMMLRNYQYGDDYRYIDWKAYARTRKLMVKVFEKEASLSLIIIVDASPAMLYGIVGKTMLEETVRVVSGLTSNLLARGDWIGLAIRSSKPILVRQGRGRTHYRRILNALSEIKWSREYPDYTIASLLKKSLLLVPKRTKTLFLVFMSLDPTGYTRDYILEAEITSLLDAINKLTLLKHSAVIVSPLPELYELQILSGIEAGIYLTSVVKGLEKTKKYVHLVRSRGVHVIQVGPTSLLPRLINFIENYRSVIT